MKNATLISSRNCLLRFGLVCILVFTLFSYFVKHDAFRTIDFDVTVKLQDTIDKSPRLRLANLVGDIMEGSTFLASPEVSMVAVFALTALLFYDRKKKNIRWVVLLIPALFFFLVMGEVYGKSVVHHPAPPFFMIKNPTTIFPKYYINEEFSYPSGHAARAGFIAMLALFLTVKRPIRRKRNLVLVGVLAVYVGLVCISRIYLGHHWLSDVIGGIVLGLGCGSIALGLVYPKRI